ncbi:MAG: hypothetical protein CMM87_03370 [Rickettsiales bacterium]|nr:hypothetical protein [Rickettsiales bacterium]|tara:strand:+ start:13182 stop:13808 length:627 start_codon:yes stop_codon:yes gene_type:complete
MNTKIIVLGILTLSVLFNPLAGKGRSAAEQRRAELRASAEPYTGSRNFRPVRDGSLDSSEYSSARGTHSFMPDEQVAGILMSLDSVKSTERKIRAAKRNLDAMESNTDRFEILKRHIDHFINIDLKSSFEKRKMNSAKYRAASEEGKLGYLYEENQLMQVNAMISNQVIRWLREMKGLVKDKQIKLSKEWMRLMKDSLDSYSISAHSV